jgi:hypothetical protein
MCTVSIVPSSSGFRIVCNRDERRTRPIAEPPTVHRMGRTRGIWPTDPAGGGTWIGANDAGLAMVLLNRRSGIARASVLSRGTIIPSVLRLPSIEEAVEAVKRLPLERFEPFTLVIVQERVVRTVTVGATSRWRAHALSTPLLFTSSSLGDALVAGPRRRLFARLVRGCASPLSGQRSFHGHIWPTRPEISVVMSRPDAATVSRTVLDVSDGAIRMHYTGISG